jgi:hypothetical protein
MKIKKLLRERERPEMRILYEEHATRHVIGPSCPLKDLQRLKILEDELNDKRETVTTPSIPPDISKREVGKHTTEVICPS